MHNALAKRAAPSPKPTLTDHMFNHSIDATEHDDVLSKKFQTEFNGQFTPLGEGRACAATHRESLASVRD